MVSEDLACITELEGSLFPFPWKKQDFMAELLFPGALCKVVIMGQRPIAYLCSRDVADGIEILKIAVHPDCRHRGIARTLIQETFIRAAASDWPLIFLEVAQNNTAAQAFYRNLGFTSTGIRKQYYPDGTDAINMIKTLKEES
nr:ribosomal protein S18-alanine N-acetyltransferase [Desulfobotulus pelophilus]